MDWLIAPVLKAVNTTTNILPTQGIGWLVIDANQNNQYKTDLTSAIAELTPGDNLTVVGLLPSGGTLQYSGLDNILEAPDGTQILNQSNLEFLTTYSVQKPPTRIAITITLTWPIDDSSPGTGSKGTIAGTLNVSVGEPPLQE